MNNGNLVNAIIYLLIGISVLLCGMKLMSDGMKKTVGKGIKNFFKKTQNNQVVSMGIGTAVTAIIQSSDATNAMVVGFINAGAMTLFQGISIMLGAYIGTTVTGVLASFSSFSFSIYLLAFAAIGTVMMFFKNEKLKNIGEILQGLGLLFFGIAVMKYGFENDTIKVACETLFTKINSGALLFLIGVVITAIMQSSSAVTSIVIAMVGSEALGLTNGLYIVLGATLGTVFNTLLASIGGSVNGKRAAWIAFSMRTITSIIMLVILLFFDETISSWMHVFAIHGVDELPIAMFTVFYNIIFMPLMLPFVKLFIKLFNKIIKDVDADELMATVHYIDDKMLVTPNVAMSQSTKEIINMFDIAHRNFNYGFAKVLNQNKDHDKEIIKLEDQCDYLNKRITDFLIKLTSRVTEQDEKIIGSYFHVINDIERIGDHAYNFYELALNMESRELKFSEKAIKELNEMNDILDKMFTLSLSLFETKDQTSLSLLHEYESKTDELKNIYYTNHYERVVKSECSTDLTSFISSMIVELERVADHLTNIGYSIVNPTGDE